MKKEEAISILKPLEGHVVQILYESGHSYTEKVVRVCDQEDVKTYRLDVTPNDIFLEIEAPLERGCPQGFFVDVSLVESIENPAPGTFFLRVHKYGVVVLAALSVLDTGEKQDE